MQIESARQQQNLCWERYSYFVGASVMASCIGGAYFGLGLIFGRVFSSYHETPMAPLAVGALPILSFLPLVFLPQQRTCHKTKALALGLLASLTATGGFLYRFSWTANC